MKLVVFTILVEWAARQHLNQKEQEKWEDEEKEFFSFILFHFFNFLFILILEKSHFPFRCLLKSLFLSFCLT